MPKTWIFHGHFGMERSPDPYHVNLTIAEWKNLHTSSVYYSNRSSFCFKATSNPPSQQFSLMIKIIKDVFFKGFEHKWQLLWKGVLVDLLKSPMLFQRQISSSHFSTVTRMSDSSARWAWAHWQTDRQMLPSAKSTVSIIIIHGDFAETCI